MCHLLLQISKAFGTDALRVWVASCDYTGDMSIGPRALEIAAGKLQRFRVLFKFLLGNIDSSTREIGSFAREDMSLVRICLSSFAYIFALLTSTSGGPIRAQ